MNKRALSGSAKSVLGKNLREARDRAGFDQAHAAELSGVGRTLISQWENGIFGPNADGLLRLAIAYRCPLDDFFSGVDERYDVIIERRIPPDAKRLYQGKLAKLKALTLHAMELTESAIEPLSPTPATPVADRRLAHDKSATAHARLKRKPPK